MCFLFSCWLLFCFFSPVWQGADGIRGLKGSKGEKVRETEMWCIKDVVLSKTIVPPQIIYSMLLFSLPYVILCCLLKWIFCLCCCLIHFVLSAGRGWFPRGKGGDGSKGGCWRQWSSGWSRRRWTRGAKRPDGPSRRTRPFWYSWRKGIKLRAHVDG